MVDPVVIGADLCTLIECGVELEVPARLCGDGSHGGYTGRCMRDELVPICHWEILECPPLPMCEPSDCGAFPAAFVASAEIVECRMTGGECRWTLQSPSGCSVDDCGVVPNDARTMLCADGTLGGFTGSCVSLSSACVWEEATCESGVVAVAPCSLSECGDRPAADLIACPDGSVAGESAQCLRQPSNACAWMMSACAPLECDTNAACGDGFCDRSSVACNGMIRGICVVRPSSCEGTASPVCGCDGVTYESECEAARMGVSVAEPGACG